VAQATTCAEAVKGITSVAVMLARPLHVSKVGQSKEKGKDRESDIYK